MPRTLFICFVLITLAAASANAIRCGTGCPPGLKEVKDCDPGEGGKKPSCICTCEATGRALEIRRFTTSTLTDADADRILTDASRVLSQKDGSADIACMFSFARHGNVTVFDIGNGIINSQKDLNSHFAMPGNIKVVNLINFCANMIGSFNGCAPISSNTQIVKRLPNPVEEGILWAHEYGHTRGLPDRNSDPVAVMNGIGLTNHLQVTNTECKAFLK